MRKPSKQEPQRWTVITGAPGVGKTTLGRNIRKAQPKAMAFFDYDDYCAPAQKIWDDAQNHCYINAEAARKGRSGIVFTGQNGQDLTRLFNLVMRNKISESSMVDLLAMQMVLKEVKTAMHNRKIPVVAMMMPYKTEKYLDNFRGHLSLPPPHLIHLTGSRAALLAVAQERSSRGVGHDFLSPASLDEAIGSIPADYSRLPNAKKIFGHIIQLQRQEIEGLQGAALLQKVL